MAWAAASNPDIPASPDCNVDPDHMCCADWVDDAQERHECMMGHSTGWDWRIFYDLADRTQAQPNGEEPIEAVYTFPLGDDAAVDDFTAGQFTSLALDIDGERVARPYSYLSSPGQQPLEFR